MQVILERVKIDLDEDEFRRLLVRLRLIGATMSTVNNPSPIRLELELLGQTVVADSMQRTASRARS